MQAAWDHALDSGARRVELLTLQRLAESLALALTAREIDHLATRQSTIYTELHSNPTRGFFAQ